MNKIPKCPNCNRKLIAVVQSEESVYKFNTKTGKYENTGHGNLWVECDCGYDLDGVINY